MHIYLIHHIIRKFLGRQRNLKIGKDPCFKNGWRVLAPLHVIPLCGFRSLKDHVELPRSSSVTENIP